MLTRKILEISEKVPWSNVLGLGRSILASGTLLTMLVNHHSYLFKPILGVDQVPICANPFSLFCLIDNIIISHWVAVILLAVVISGWRPRYTGIIHWWVSYSFINSATVVDGGDHITSILTLLLIPYTLTDNRTWHWQPYRANVHTLNHGVKSLIAQSAILILRIQIALIYLNAAAAKIGIPEWADGTAIYYWFSHPVFGRPDWMGFIIDPLISNEVTVTILTWGAIIFEFILFAGFFMDKRYRMRLFIAGIFFHLAIIFVHGLVSFFFAMTGALVLYLTDLYSPLLINFNYIPKLLKIDKRPAWHQSDQG